MPGCCPTIRWSACRTRARRAWWARALADPQEARGTFVADDEEMGVVGFGSCGTVRELPDGLDGTERRVGEIYTLYVESDFQNQGLGRRLLDAMFRQLHTDPLRLRRAVDAGRQLDALLLRGHGRPGRRPPPRALRRRAGRRGRLRLARLALPLVRRKLAPEAE